MKSKGYRIRLTEEEFNKLSKAAEQSGCTKAEYIRNKMQFSNTNPEMKTLAEIREEAYNQGRAEAIDEFADFIADKCDCCTKIKNKCSNGHECLIWRYAEQLKEN